MAPAQERQRDQEIVIYPARGRLVTAAVLAAGFAVLSLAIVLLPDTFRTNVGDRLIMGAGVLFFGGLSLFLVLRLRRPLLVISREGLIAHTPFLRSGLIRWNDVREVVIHRFMRQRFLGIVPASMDTLLARRSPAWRWLLRVNYGLTRAPINIPERLLPMSLEELLAIVDRYRRP
ncbi:MAG TPA: STM3941 family protein [Methylomirabilota bacterium]|nr:STM3941 family protein [Methylomirabilota bacterium]